MQDKYEILVCGPLDSANDAIHSLLHSTLNHVAKVQLTMLEVLSEKYGHSVEDMVEVLRDSKQFNPQQLALNPVAAKFVEVAELKTKKGRKVLVSKK